MIDPILAAIKAQDMICPYCGKLMDILTGAELYGDKISKYDKRCYYFNCVLCDARVFAANPNDPNVYIREVKFAANKQVRKLRSFVHMRMKLLYDGAGIFTHYEILIYIAEQMGIDPEDFLIYTFDYGKCMHAMSILDDIMQIYRSVLLEEQQEEEYDKGNTDKII